MSDTELWWTAAGDGPPVVLCHGGPGLWDDLAPLAAYVDDLDRLREHVGHERWFVVGTRGARGSRSSTRSSTPTGSRASVT